MNNIFLIGMPGCGKSAVGRLIAKRTGRKFYDADNELESYYGRKISDIFADDGEDTFREMESETIKRLSSLSGAVIATGGGAVLRSINMEIAKTGGTVVFIDRSVNDILSDIVTAHRPLLADGAEKLHSLYNSRIDLYRKYADITVENTKDLDYLTDKIIKGVELYENNGN